MQAGLVAIHQPNFWPWLGYFNKISRVETFVFMDNVQFPETGRGTWINRVKMFTGPQVDWMTVPVNRTYQNVRLIREMQLAADNSWRRVFLKRLERAYGRAPYFKQVYPVVATWLAQATQQLRDFNLFALRDLINRLQLNSCRFVMGSDLAVSGNASDLLISIVQAVGGRAYLCGSGARDYQEEDKFSAAGIQLIHQNFKHPVYPQVNSASFVPGLSVVDALFNHGFDNTAQLIRRQD